MNKYKTELITRINGLDALVDQIDEPNTFNLFKIKVKRAVMYYNRRDYFAVSLIIKDIRVKALRRLRNNNFRPEIRRVFGYIYERAGEIESITSLASLHFS